jgi:methionyl-tRNA formyltransferase
VNESDVTANEPSSHKRVVLLGSKLLGLRAARSIDAAVPGALRAIVTIDDTADARSVLQEFRSTAAAIGTDVVVLNKPSQLAGTLLELKPDLIVVVGWYWILTEEVLSLAPLGFVGCHASLLPKYRGNAPLVWAILRGESETGVTMFYFDSGMDTGDIVSQARFPIGPDDTIATVLGRTDDAITELLTVNVPLICHGTAPRRQQNHADATYCSLRRPEDGEIPWNSSAITVHNFVRAQTAPYPGAFTTLPDGRRLQIWKTEVFPAPFYGIAGLVCQRDEHGVVVTTGESGAVVVVECSIDGVPTPPHDALRWGLRLT